LLPYIGRATNFCGYSLIHKYKLKLRPQSPRIGF
jgi:hypothetical protein